jgi:D-alanyl-D-alanine carboxypeptidase (penicillin-binding protein 5/6)
MKKIAAIFLLLSVLFGMAASVSAEDTLTVDRSVTEGCNSIQGTRPLRSDQILDTSEAALLYEMNTGTLIYGWNMDEQMYPSSLVKIMTALLAIERGDLSQIVTATKTALSSVSAGAVSVELQEGERMTLQDLLYCMMVASGNDAAAVIAEHIGGSQSAFVELMNQRALELGCMKTHYSNAHGLHDDAQVTTARDTAVILMKALEYPVFQELFGTVTYEVAATNLSDIRKISTSNLFMNPDLTDAYVDDRVTGGRTGVDKDDDRCLASTAEVGDMKFLSVVIGANTVYEDNGWKVRTYGNFEETQYLLDVGFNNYSIQQVLYQGQIVRQYPVTGGENAIAGGATETIRLVLPNDITMDKLQFQYTDSQTVLNAPVQAGKQLSTLNIRLGEVCIAQTPVYAVNSSGTLTDRHIGAGKEKSGRASMELLVIVVAVLMVIAVAVAAVLYLSRMMRLAAIRSRSRRRRQNRRRSR